MTMVMYNINGKGRATVKGTANANKRNYKLIFQDNPSFRSWYRKLKTHSLTIKKVFILLCQCIICWNIANIILWHQLFCGNNNANENNVADDYRINDNKTTTRNSFEYKAKIIGSTTVNINTLDTEVVVPLKYLSSIVKHNKCSRMANYSGTYSSRCDCSKKSSSPLLVQEQQAPQKWYHKKNIYDNASSVHLDI